MAEPKVFVSEDGQGIEQADIELMAANGSYADDRIIAELYRLNGRSSPNAPERGIITFGMHQRVGVGYPWEQSGLVMTSEGADASVRVFPFRAVIGPQVAYASSEDTHSDGYRGVRSALHLGDPEDGNGFTERTLSPSGGDPRFDLIYASVAVDQDGPVDTRYIKQADDNAIADEIPTTKVTTVTINVAEGTEAATPVRPSTPADSAGVYNIPLAYVFIPDDFDETSTIADKGQIQDIAPVLTMAPAAGAAGGMRVAKLNRTLPTAGGDDIDGTAAPAMYIPASMVGHEWVFFAVSPDEMGATETWLTLDDTRDWRNRVFILFLNGANFTPRFGWDAAQTVLAPPSASDGDELSYMIMANSFVHGTNDNTERIVRLTEDNFPLIPSGESIDIRCGAAIGRVGRLDIRLSSGITAAHKFVCAMMVSGPMGEFELGV